MLSEVLEAYFKLHPQDRNRLYLIQKQLTAKQKLNGRQNYTGHVTGSALIFSPDRTKILLIYHPTFSRWQQPGGHWEDFEAGPWEAAVREAAEETGVKIRKRLSAIADKRVPVDIDTHLVKKIPPKNEPDHYHHDFKYAFLADSERLKLEDKVIKEAVWEDISSIKHPDLLRAIKRVQASPGLKA